MKEKLKLLWIGFFASFLITCSYHEDEKAQLGPDIPYSLVVYFKKGTTEEEVGKFYDDVLTDPPDERGQGLIDGIGSYLRLTPHQGKGHWAIAITFYRRTTEARRNEIKHLITSNDLVYKVFEGVAPNDITESDLR